MSSLELCPDTDLASDGGRHVPQQLFSTAGKVDGAPACWPGCFLEHIVPLALHEKLLDRFDRFILHVTREAPCLFL